MIARTEREAARQAAVAERRKALFERYAQPRVKRALIDCSELVSEMYAEGGEVKVTTYFDTDATAILAPVLNDLYDRIIRALGSEAKNDIKGWAPLIETKTTEDSVDVVTQNMLDLFAQYAFTQSTEIAKTLEAEAIGYVAKLLADEADVINQGPKALARELRKYTTGLTPYKSEMIARTETLLSYSEAQDNYTQEIWDEAEDGPLYKRWYANRDRRTRDDHKKMNRKFVLQDDVFLLPNGDRMKYPGDRSARTENIVNCRCTYSSFIKDED